jgi:hypothetical protein
MDKKKARSNFFVSGVIFDEFNSLGKNSLSLRSVTNQNWDKTGIKCRQNRDRVVVLLISRGLSPLLLLVSPMVIDIEAVPASDESDEAFRMWFIWSVLHFICVLSAFCFYFISSLTSFW